jgi:hypothetical protein
MQALVLAQHRLDARLQRGRAVMSWLTMMAPVIRPVGCRERNGGIQMILCVCVEALDLDLLVERRLALPDRARRRPLLGGDRLASAQPPALVLAEFLGTDVACSRPDVHARGIALDDAAAGIHDPHADRQRLEHRLQQPLAGLQRVLGSASAR